MASDMPAHDSRSRPATNEADSDVTSYHETIVVESTSKAWLRDQLRLALRQRGHHSEGHPERLHTVRKIIELRRKA